MRSNKGFTFIEVAVVVVLIAVISLMAFPSYNDSRVVAQNEMARAKLSELATAARMYNEGAKGTSRLAGGLGEAGVADFTDPAVLFSKEEVLMGSLGLDSHGWGTIPSPCVLGGSCLYRFAGYRYYVCNPDLNAPAAKQPAGSGCNGTQIAVMRGPLQSEGLASSSLVYTKYGGHSWWISNTNLGVIGSDFTGN
jgi:prepilin-type N-terminal cleavage/methylation domain-containing protein